MKKRFEKLIAGEKSMKYVAGGPTAVKGITANGVHCGLKAGGALDLALFYSDAPLKTVAFYTQNKLLGAHVHVFRKTLKASRGRTQALLVNSKIANCATGDRGELDNLIIASALAQKLGLKPGRTLFASTGVIGERLPVEKITSGLEPLVRGLSAKNGSRAARAIMTTDTVPKSCAVEVTIGKKTFRIGGVAKGSGMIRPNMATMLAFIFTDADVALPTLRKVAGDCVSETFNCISVDGDTSPNDVALASANGKSGVKIESKKNVEIFRVALEAVMEYLAIELVRDGEGASKLVEIKISGARTVNDARSMAREIANSQLVKTAVHGEDPNWGRILSAAGVSGAAFDPARARLEIDGECVYDRGALPALKKKIMKGKEVFILLDAGMGSRGTRYVTCDLSSEYVRINADYTT